MNILEGIWLSEISQRQIQYDFHLYMESNKTMNKHQNRKRVIIIGRNQIVRREGCGERSDIAGGGLRCIGISSHKVNESWI